MMTDDEFLRIATHYISRKTILAAYDVAHDIAALDEACRDYGARPTCVQAILGRLRGARLVDGVVRSTGEFVDPWVVPALYEPNDQELCAAFAIYRTVEQRRDAPLLVRYGDRVH